MNQRPRVSLITVNLDGRAHLEVLLESVARQTYPADRIEVLVVDNGSTDGTVEFLKQRYPDVRVLRNETNMGFARPNNQAAAIAEGEFLALVNNDMRLADDWVETMVDFIEAAGSDVACVGSRILNWDGSRVDFIRGTMAFNGMGFQPGYDLPVDAAEAGDYPKELLFACGGAMVIRRSVYLDVGGLDEDYFAYYEDVDLGWRLWVLGYRVLFCPEAVVRHRHNGTSSRFAASKKVALFERNAMLSVLKNYEDATLRQVWPATLLLAFKRLAVRSGIDREAYRFAPALARPAPVGSGGLRKLASSLRRNGLKATAKKVLVQFAKKVLVRWGGGGYEEAATPILREAYATVVGMEDIIDALPRVRVKRADIQARRRRSDAEVFRRFGDALTPVEGRGGYPDSHALITAELGLETLFGGLAAPQGADR